MTSQTKRFIEVSDIVGVRLECKKCGCALLLGLSHKDAIANLLEPANKILSTCPTCGGIWASLPNGLLAFDTEIKDFFRRMEQIKEIESKFGFRLSLEVREEKPTINP